MTSKKVVVFNGKQFYNARHLYNYLHANYFRVHEISYQKVLDAVSKRLKSADKFFKLDYVEVSATRKKRLKRYIPINEGYEEIIALIVNNVDDFIIQYLAIKDHPLIMTYKDLRNKPILAWKGVALLRLCEKYKPEYADKLANKIMGMATLGSDGYMRYELQPTSIKQNIF